MDLLPGWFLVPSFLTGIERALAMCASEVKLDWALCQELGFKGASHYDEI
jgi:hypothetical protein